MALRFVDSFDHYAIGDIFSKWTAGSGFTDSTEMNTGRFGGSGFRHVVDGRFIYKTLDAQATWIIGAAWKPETLQNYRLFSLWDGTSEQTSLNWRSDGKFEVFRGGSTSLGTSSVSVAAGVWYYVEFKCTVHNSTGIAQVKVNGTTVINLSSQDTQATGNATADRVRLGGGAQFSVWASWDDLYMCDGTGSSPSNDFLGDVKVQAIFPNGNGNSSVLVGSDGNSTNNYLLVDETAPNSDTDYVESSTVGDKDTYTYGDLTATTGTVYGVQVVPWARKTDAGTRTIASIARLSGTEIDSADKTLGASYTYLSDIRETKPGGGAWSVSDVNSAEFGSKVTT